MERNTWPGARWWKFDLHAHTPGSMDYVSEGPARTAADWLRYYMAAEVDCVAVTDHNSGAWVDKLKSELRRMREEAASGFRDLQIFPGVELSVSGGVHILAIFDTDKGSADIDTLLGAVEYTGTKGDSDGVSRKSPVEVAETIARLGGLAIPAHTDEEKGLLRTREFETGRAHLDPNTVDQLLKCPQILAMEVVDQAAPRPGLYAESKVRGPKSLVRTSMAVRARISLRRGTPG